MTFTTVIRDIGVQTLANVISNLAWFILIYWGVKTLVKNVPSWIDKYERIRKEQRAIDIALSKRSVKEVIG
ncbi:MAG: hypothetical protein WD512_15380 [Candidatus Paceibacterota bacterium]